MKLFCCSKSFPHNQATTITALSEGGRQQSLLVDTTFPGEWSAETKSEIGGRVCRLLVAAVPVCTGTQALWCTGAEYQGDGV